MLVRNVQPEILDSLPADDPAARRSRRDLRLINALMGNFRWVERRLRSQQPETPVIELGAGEGRLLKRLSALGFRTKGIDLAPRPADLPDDVIWEQQDLFDGANFDGATIVATLFLHHLDQDALTQLGCLLSGARALIFSEPSRSRMSLAGGYVMFPFVNHVTRHDMIISIRAGFRGGELRRALRLDDRWEVHEETGLLGACRLFARKR